MAALTEIVRGLKPDSMNYPQNPPLGFCNYAKLAFVSHPLTEGEIQEGTVQKNLCERIGDVMVWHIVELPKKIWNFISDPRVVTIALTALTMLTITAICYPVGTWLVVKSIVVAVLPYLTPVVIKLAICLFANYTILGFGTRAFGRMWNQNLITAYDKKVKSEE
jgi:hypothetical protein